MKKYFLKTSGALLFGICLATGLLAQEKPKERERVKRSSSDDVIIIKSNGKKDSKVTIEIKDGEVKVNGKPLSEFKDEGVSITRRKELGFDRDLAMLDGMGAAAPPSRFRSGAWSFNGDQMPAIAGFDENKAFLGVTTEKEEGDGVKVTDVSDESAADKAGIKEGDIITKINDEKIDDPEDLSKTIGKFKPEEKITVTVLRDKKEQKLAATLGKRKNNFVFASPQFGQLKGMEPFAQSYSFNCMNGRGRLGLKAQETEDGKGLKVLDVDDESPADKAGIKEGDIITEFDGAEVDNIDKLRELSKAALAKPSFKIKVNRDGKSQDIDVKIPKNLKTTNL